MITSPPHTAVLPLDGFVVNAHAAENPFAAPVLPVVHTRCAFPECKTTLVGAGFVEVGKVPQNLAASAYASALSLSYIARQSLPSASAILLNCSVTSLPAGALMVASHVWLFVYLQYTVRNRCPGQKQDGAWNYY